MITEVAGAAYLETKEFIKIAKNIQNQVEPNKKQSLRIECNKGIGTISTFVKIDDNIVIPVFSGAFAELAFLLLLHLGL